MYAVLLSKIKTPTNILKEEENMNTMPIYNKQDDLLMSRISWSAILAGVIVGLTVGSLFNLLGIGLGFAVFNPDSDTLAKISMGSAAWLYISGIVGTLGIGYVSGWCANTPCRFTGALHGFISWGLATLFTFVLIASGIGTFMSGSANLFGQSMSLVAKAAPAVGKGVTQAMETAKDVLPDKSASLKQISQQIDRIAEHLPTNTSTESQSKDQFKEKLSQTIKELLSAKEDNKTSAREKLLTFLNQNTDMTSSQAEQTVTDWEQFYERSQEQINQKIAQAKEQAKVASKKAANIASSISFTIFSILLISAITAMIAGSIGSSMTKNSQKKA